MPNTAPEATGDGIAVAAAVIYGPDGRILISRRPAHLHQGGLWEFPGGKLEAGESGRHALQRELAEELDIRVVSAEPLIRIPWTYPDKRLLLEVWSVGAFHGEPRACEGQALRWVAPAALNDLSFPAANAPIVTAVQLPDRYLITPEPGPDAAPFLATLERAVDRDGIRLLQLRAHSLGAMAYAELAIRVSERLRGSGVEILLNAPPALAAELGLGVHLTAARLRALARRPLLPAGCRVAASCHDAAELQQAAALGLDFAVLGPVFATGTHPGASVLGFDRFSQLAREAPLPVFALGGLSAAQIVPARQHGAQGVAAIRGLWPAALNA